jgi:hypothetical protein
MPLDQGFEGSFVAVCGETRHQLAIRQLGNAPRSYQIAEVPKQRVRVSGCHRRNSREHSVVPLIVVPRHEGMTDIFPGWQPEEAMDDYYIAESRMLPSPAPD